MTERGRGQVDRSATRLSIGPSTVSWDGSVLDFAINESAMPWPAPCRGRVRVWPQAMSATTFTLDSRGRHRWRPMAPRAKVEVDFTDPALRWNGSGYVDCNHGDEPLEAAFSRWDWSRAHMADGSSTVLYDTTSSTGLRNVLALSFGAEGQVEPFEAPVPAALPTTAWRLARTTRCDAAGRAHVVQTLEDAPFYARSTLITTLRGETVTAVHESLSLRRFERPWVQAMLPFRMPRALNSRNTASA